MKALFQPEHIPSELIGYGPQFVCLREIPQPDGKKAVKEPVNPHNGHKARTHNDAKKEAAGLYTDRPEDTWGVCRHAIMTQF